MTDNKPETPMTIEVVCPHHDLLGQHTVTLELPVIDDSIGIDPLCMQQYRVRTGPPIVLSKHEDA
ncbi:MAG: hypothetical protein RL701_4383 [Pseudomonadota bacterium]|jgi:hypothetical protein